MKSLAFVKDGFRQRWITLVRQQNVTEPDYSNAIRNIQSVAHRDRVRVAGLTDCSLAHSLLGSPLVVSQLASGFAMA